MRGQEFSNPFHLVEVKEVGGHRHTYQSPGYPRAGYQILTRLLQSVHGRGAVTVEFMPGISEFQLPGRSLHEPGAEVLFQFLNAPADRIGGNPQSTCGLRETAE